MNSGVTRNTKLAGSSERQRRKDERVFQDYAATMRAEREAAEAEAEREREAIRQANEEAIARHIEQTQAEARAKGTAFRDKQIAKPRAYHPHQGPYAWLDNARFEAKLQDELLPAFERYLDGAVRR